MAASSSKERRAKKPKGENPEGPNWLELPTELTAKILSKLGAFEIFTATQVCSSWWKICKEPLTWHTIDLTKHPRKAHTKLLRFCRHAIQQSRGQLQDISIEDIATDEVLKWIADSGRQLRRMRLLKCFEVSDEGLIELVKKLPLLEEFEISFSELCLPKDTLELLGKCCPNLKVLKFNMEEEKDFECDDEALAIAKTMPQLCHLQLLGNRLTNHGLLAILAGCPNLESLDLRVCSNVDLSGSLGERCRKQIRDLRLPEDLSDDVSIYIEGGNDYGYARHCGCDIDREAIDREYEGECLLAIERDYDILGHCLESDSEYEKFFLDEEDDYYGYDIDREDKERDRSLAHVHFGYVDHL